MKVFSNTLLDEMAAQATASARGRAHHNIHASPGDLVQRFLVVADRRTYFRPHRHLVKSELATLLRGSFDILLFDGDGVVTARHSLGGPSGGSAPAFAYELPCATWHTLIAQADGSSFLEVKEGPYDPTSAAEFASWAPAEGDASVPAFHAWLSTAKVGDRAADHAAVAR